MKAILLIATALFTLKLGATTLTCEDIAKEKDDLVAAQMILSAVDSVDNDAVYGHVLAGVERIKKGRDALGKIVAYQDMKERLIQLCIAKDRDLIKAITSRAQVNGN